MEQVPASSPLAPYVSVDPDGLGGEPVFRNTRVPIRSMFEHLAADYSLDEFLDQFEGVTRDQARAVIDLAAKGLMTNFGQAA
jgi:uncharacterized protein (DUF433 family)